MSAATTTKPYRTHCSACGKRLESKAELSIANLGKVKVRPDHENVRIAYQAWVELTTRKAALPFDEEHDVISEVYASWYTLFGTIRELIKTVPSHRLRDCENTQRLINNSASMMSRNK